MSFLSVEYFVMFFFFFFFQAEDGIRDYKVTGVQTCALPIFHSPYGTLKKSKLDDAVEKALREVSLWDGLKDRLHTRATTLQLEQQQKLCIARLLPLKPEIILMDEPCSALDTEATLGIEELMLSLAGRYTMLIVTHNMAQARRVSQECAFMLLGEVVEHARTEDLFLTPRRSEEHTSELQSPCNLVCRLLLE